MKEYTIHVGEEVRLYEGGLIATDPVIYAGMPTPNIFSLIIRGAGFRQGWAYNLYYPQDTASLILAGKELSILEVTPDYVRVTID